MSDQGDRIAEEAVKHLEIGGGPNQSLENRQAYKQLCRPFDPAWAQDDFSKNHPLADLGYFPPRPSGFHLL